MKKFTWIILAVILTLSVALESCSKDKDEPDAPATTKEKVIGTWKAEVNANSHIKVKVYLNFAQDGGYEAVLVQYYDAELAQEYGKEVEVSDAFGTWMINGTNLVVDGEMMPILKVNSTTLVLDMDNDGFQTTFTRCTYAEMDAARDEAK